MLAGAPRVLERVLEREPPLLPLPAEHRQRPEHLELERPELRGRLERREIPERLERLERREDQARREHPGYLVRRGYLERQECLEPQGYRERQIRLPRHRLRLDLMR